MFRNLLSRLFDDASDRSPLGGQDAEVAIAALLIRVARSDDRYARIERVQIDRIIGQRRGVGSVEAAERRAAAEMIEAEAPGTEALGRTIVQRVPREDRLAVAEAMWAVVYADGRGRPVEEAMVRDACALLGVSDADVDLLRRQAAEAGGEVG